MSGEQADDGSGPQRRESEPPSPGTAATTLPQLREELSGEAGHELLAAATDQVGVELGRVHLRAVHERAGRSVSFVFEAALRIDGRTLDSLLVAHADTRGFPAGALVLERGPARVAVWRFPQDPYLPGLPSTIDPDRVRALLDQLGAAAGVVTLRTRAYRPTRRAVVEVTIDGPVESGRVLYLKVLGGRRAERLGDAQRHLADHVPVPRVFGVDTAQGILAMEALAGATLRQALVDGAAVPAPEELVELSQRIARSALRTRKDPRAFADPTRHITPLSRIVPDQADLITRVAHASVVRDAAMVPVHGDLHDGQVLVQDGRVSGLLDVDGAGDGLMAEDAGNLVAHTAAIGEVRPAAAGAAEDYAARLADAYRPLVGADALARATAAAWVALATGPYRSQESGWPETTRRRLARAEAELPARP